MVSLVKPNCKADNERKLAFHEKRMNDPHTPKYWREKSEVMYWHYLDLLTK